MPQQQPICQIKLGVLQIMPKRNRGAHLKWIENRQSWYVVWYEGGRERKKSAGTRNRLEAEQALSQHIIEKDQHNDIVNPTRRVLADVLAAYRNMPCI
jgi:hypothetical protein